MLSIQEYTIYNFHMDAKQARTEYFEEYIYFEFLIRELSRKMLIIEQGRTLGEVIQSISDSKEFSTMMIKTKHLKKHKSIRNWLAHQHSNSKVSAVMESNFLEINDLNNRIKNNIKII